MLKYLFIISMLIFSPVEARQTSTLIYNETLGETVHGENLNITRPIASLTKLMTAMVSLDYDGNLQRKIPMPGSNKIPAGNYTREELMTAMLVRSDNGAAEALAADYPGGRKAFIRAMNRKAEKIGMTFTKFADPSGLSSQNLSNVGAVGIMLQVSVLYPFIRESSIQKEISIESRKRTIILDNTNKPLLYDFDEIIMSKTGFTNSSGWSVGLVVEKYGQRFSVVVLGAETKNQRYEITRNLIQNYFDQLAATKLDNEGKRSYNNTSIWDRIKDWLKFY
jgi:D-alanyl-D-alanine endopeptidase (penicillin-binding protein 7)